MLKNIYPKREEQFYYEIVDVSNNVVGTGKIIYDFTQKEDDINWKKVEWKAYYNAEENRLYIKPYILGITSEPYGKYTISITKKWWSTRYSEELLYDKMKGQLYSVIEFRWKEKKYTFEYSIQNASHRIIEDGVFKIKLFQKLKLLSIIL